MWRIPCLTLIHRKSSSVSLQTKTGIISINERIFRLLLIVIAKTESSLILLDLTTVTRNTVHKLILNKGKHLSEALTSLMVEEQHVKRSKTRHFVFLRSRSRAATSDKEQSPILNWSELETPVECYVKEI